MTVRPTTAALVLPGALAQTMAAALERHAAAAGVPLVLEVVAWVDDPAVRRAKAAADRSSAWIEKHEPPLDDAQQEALRHADVVVAFELPAATPRLASHARFVQATSAGVAPFVGVLRGTSLRLSSAAGLSGDKVAEFAMARLLTVWSDGRTLDALQHSRRWAPRQVDTTPIAGRRVLVVGTGGIGQALAQRARAFGIECVGVRRRPELGAPAGFERVVGQDGLLAELPGADAVVLALPATERTAQLIGETELAAMKPGAVLCNVARGSLVDEAALVAVLTAGHLGAAVLDVTVTEPLSRRSPLWRAPNVWLSPHVANDWLPGYVDAIARLTVENVVRDGKGEPLVNLVDLTEGY